MKNSEHSRLGRELKKLQEEVSSRYRFIEGYKREIKGIQYLFAGLREQRSQAAVLEWKIKNIKDKIKNTQQTQAKENGPQ